MSEKERMKEFIAMQTCGEARLQKMKTILENSKKIINKDLTKLTIPDVAKFLQKINHSSYKEWTKNDYKKIFRAFIKFQYKKEFTEWTENKSIKDGFKNASKKRAFNKDKINKETLVKPEELEKLLRKTKSLKWKAFLTLLYESAFRPCEIVNLKWRDLDFIDSKNICNIKTISPKTKEMRTIPVRDCIVHLKRWREEFEFPDIKENDFVFPNPQDRTKHLTEMGVGLIIGRRCEEAGVRHLYPYMFRHSRIYFIQKRLGARISSKYAGHSLATSEIYNHLDSDDVEEAMLSKIYVTEELEPAEENELKRRIEKLEKAFRQQAENEKSELSKEFVLLSAGINDEKTFHKNLSK